MKLVCVMFCLLSGAGFGEILVCWMQKGDRIGRKKSGFFMGGAYWIIDIS